MNSLVFINFFFNNCSINNQTLPISYQHLWPLHLRFICCYQATNYSTNQWKLSMYNKLILVNVINRLNLVADQKGQNKNEKSEHHLILESTYLFVIFTFCHQNIQNIKEFSLLSQCSPKGCSTFDLEKLTNSMNLMYHSFQSDK